MAIKKLIEMIKKSLYKLYRVLVFPFSALSIIVFHYLEKSQFKIHEDVITVSERSKKDIIKYYNIDKKNIKVIPNGVNLEKFNPDNYSEEIRDKYGDHILLYSGLMVERKNIPILLRAFKHVLKKLPDIQLVLTGEGPVLEESRKLSEELNIQEQTTFLGFVSDQKLLELLATSDIFVFPSKLEGFGQVIVESLASGTPVICSNIPPMSDIIDGAGITFKVGSSQDLANQIIKLFENDKLYNKVKKNTLQIAEEYRWSNIAREYQSYIEKVLESK